MADPTPERRTGDALVQVIASKLESLHGDVGDMKDVLKDLTSAVTKLAIVEERQGQASLALERAFKVLEKVEGRLDALEKAAPLQAQTSSWVHAGVGAIGMLMLAFVAKKMGLS